jgi:NIPSNAP
MEALAVQNACAVVELRQYTLHPGQRDVLIRLFEREFIGPLEGAGMTVMGQFHDLDRPDRFVWMRGFVDMARRAQGLAAFYGGPIWSAHRDAANATMIASDNVLLLRPAHAGASIRLPPDRPAGAAARATSARIVATISPLARPADRARIAAFESRLAPALKDAGARLLGCYVTETGANSFPRLPVREGEHVFIWFAAFADAAEYERFIARQRASAAWHSLVAEWERGLVAAPETLCLAPTARSLMQA